MNRRQFFKYSAILGIGAMVVKDVKHDAVMWPVKYGLTQPRHLPFYMSESRKFKNGELSHKIDVIKNYYDPDEEKGECKTYEFTNGEFKRIN